MSSARSRILEQLETWVAALKTYDEDDYEKALDLFAVKCLPKILTNIGSIYVTLGNHEAAVERFMEARDLRSDLAVANCEQEGLNFRLFSAEILFNQGLALICLGRPEEGLADMEEAKRVKVTDKHNIIDKAIEDFGKGHAVFRVVGCPINLASCGGGVPTISEGNEQCKSQKLNSPSARAFSPIRCSARCLIQPGVDSNGSVWRQDSLRLKFAIATEVVNGLGIVNLISARARDFKLTSPLFLSVQG
ncbi:hypothetical protein B0H17DRAFT_1133473 [Mycena rosella]|uniref:NADPH oxidase regulator NoxR n=1 Tax=Mycena rosella TaxID=1033263 RepID=A0AAD7DI44_MYCRO|nr:hypothetical protein B0H17DRAFT_1133473 [Mycena rosella]